MKWFKKIFKKKEKLKLPPSYYKQVSDMPTTIDFKLGKSSEKWRIYNEKYKK